MTKVELDALGHQRAVGLLQHGALHPEELLELELLVALHPDVGVLELHAAFRVRVLVGDDRVGGGRRGLARGRRGRGHLARRLLPSVLPLLELEGGIREALEGERMLAAELLEVRVLRREQGLVLLIQRGLRHQVGARRAQLGVQRLHLLLALGELPLELALVLVLTALPVGVPVAVVGVRTARRGAEGHQQEREGLGRNAA